MTQSLLPCQHQQETVGQLLLSAVSASCTSTTSRYVWGEGGGGEGRIGGEGRRGKGGGEGGEGGGEGEGEETMGVKRGMS